MNEQKYLEWDIPLTGYKIINKRQERHANMKVGITLPHLGSAATRENIIHMAKIAEQERFDSLWVFERLLWPLKPQTPFG